MRGLQVLQTLVFGWILMFPRLPEGFARLRIGEPHREGEAPLERRLLENNLIAWVADNPSWESL